MKALVTGATGFLGKFLCEALCEKGIEVVPLNSKNCDLTQEGSLNQFNNHAFDVIFHLAAWTQAGDFCLFHPGEQWLINQKINTHLLSWWHQAQKQAKLISIGTSCSYDPELPLKEEYYLSGLPTTSLFTYAMTKRMLLVGMQALHKQFGMKYLCLVPSTLYGPSYHTDGRQMHFIFDLIRKVMRGALYEEPVILWGNGEQVRELIHVRDFVSILLSLLSTAENTTINIGSGKGHTIKEFASFICKRLHYPEEKIQFDTTKYVGARSKVLSTEKFRSLMPSVKLTPLSEGLFETIDWFEKAELFR